jgi:hypothetical protein
MRAVLLMVALCAVLAACTMPGAALATTPTPSKSARLTAQQAIDGLKASGTVRVGDVLNPVAPGAGGTEEASLLLYVGPSATSSTAIAYLVAAPPGADMASLRTKRLDGLNAAASANPLGGAHTYLVAQDRNVLLYLGFAKSDNPEADRATVEAALKAIP